MIRIECEVSDLKDLINGKVDEDTKELSYLRGEMSALQNQKYDMEEELRRVRADLYQALKSPPLPSAERLARELVQAVAANAKIQSIKVIREMTGLGLKEAKDLFEASYQKGLDQPKPNYG